MTGCRYPRALCWLPAGWNMLDHHPPPLPEPQHTLSLYVCRPHPSLLTQGTSASCTLCPIKILTIKEGSQGEASPSPMPRRAQSTLQSQVSRPAGGLQGAKAAAAAIRHSCSMRQHTCREGWAPPAMAAAASSPAARTGLLLVASCSHRTGGCCCSLPSPHAAHAACRRASYCAHAQSCRSWLTT
jgi:hypothetical protein